MKTTRTIFCGLLLGCTLASAAQRLAILSDVHVTPGNACDSALRVAVAEINATPIDLVVMCGDLTNEGSDEQLANIKTILDQITHPLAIIPGNHENTWSQSATKTFVDLWGNDRFAVPVDSGLVAVGINCGPFMKMGDGHIKQEDLHWLRKTLASVVKPGQKVLSFNHYPLLDDLDNYTDYIEVLQDYPAIAHINGHHHRWRHYRAGENDSVPGNIDGIMVRALDMRKGDYGYTLVDIDPQWVHVYNKPLGAEAEPMYAFPVRTSHTPLPSRTIPEIAAPEGYDVTKVWTDSASIFTRLGFDRENVYLGTSTGVVRAIAKADSKQRWATPTGASLFGRPSVLKKGTVAVPTPTGIAFLDPRNGRIKTVDNSAHIPYVADGVVTAEAYYQGGYKRFERRNPVNGKTVWVYDSINNYCQAAPTVYGNDVIFGAWDTNLRCLDTRTGRLRWVWNNGKSANMLGPGNVVPVVNDKYVVIVAPDRFMTMIDRATGKTVWRDKSHRYREALGANADSTVAYAKTMDGELVAVDATSPQFTELWTVDMGLGYEHAPCIVGHDADGIVYAGSRRGLLTMVDPTTQAVIARLPLGVSEINGIDTDPHTGDIYVSLIEGTVYRISKK